MHDPASVARTALAALVLVTNVAGLRSPDYSLRKKPPNNCGFAEYGSELGTAQRLEDTQLSPGVSDWNIVVPMLPQCAKVPVTGVRMRVCDDDAPPDVSLTDAQTARVHRTGSLASAAAVNVTVYCILPPPLPPLHLTDSRSSFEMYSKEPHSNEVTSNEEISHDLESIELMSAELVKPVKLTPSTTLAPALEETIAQVEHTSPAEMITPPPHHTVQRKEKSSQSLKVTINIAPTNTVSKKEDTVSQSHDAELPSLSNKDKTNAVTMSSQSPTSSSVPFIETQISGLPPRKPKERPRGLNQPRGATPPRAPLPPRGPPRLPWPPRPHPGMPQPPQYMPALPFAAVPPYKLSQLPYPLAPMYRPLSLLGPRLTFLQRHRPLLIFRHF